MANLEVKISLPAPENQDINLPDGVFPKATEEVSRECGPKKAPPLKPKRPSSSSSQPALVHTSESSSLKSKNANSFTDPLQIGPSKRATRETKTRAKLEKEALYDLF